METASKGKANLCEEVLRKTRRGKELLNADRLKKNLKVSGLTLKLPLHDSKIDPETPKIDPETLKSS